MFLAALLLATPVNLFMATTVVNAFLDPYVARRRLERLKTYTNGKLGLYDIGKLALTEEEKELLHRSGALQVLAAAKQREEDLRAVGAV